MRIVSVETLKNCGPYSQSRHWADTRSLLHRGVEDISWPPGSGAFTIYPESGKKRGEGNGVKPIKNDLLVHLRDAGWQIEGPAKNAVGSSLGDFDAVLNGPEGPVIVEWETGNVASSHRSLNKMSMLLMNGIIAAGSLVVPSRKLYIYLTDRIGNAQELEPYYHLWRSVPCERGVLEVIVIQHDATSFSVPRIPKGTDGRALG